MVGTELAERLDSATLNPREPVAMLLRDLRSGPDGLSMREAARRLQVHGPNELPQRSSRCWWKELLRQFTHPLALLLWVAAVLALVSGAPQLSIAILSVIVLNAVLAFVQKQQAEHAVEALGQYLPQQAWAIRDGHRQHIPARDLVRGDVLVIDEGERISADARLLSGSIEVDLSGLLHRGKTSLGMLKRMCCSCRVRPVLRRDRRSLASGSRGR